MRILLADDERELAMGLALYLRESGHEVCAITTGGLDVLPAYDHFHPDVVLMDVLMPRFDGITICQALLSRYPGARLVLCSGALSPDHPFIAASGACRFIAKPFVFSQARELLESLVPTARAAA
jgi:two-component system chemotaxis response regulator CheY